MKVARELSNASYTLIPLVSCDLRMSLYAFNAGCCLTFILENNYET